MRPSSSIVSAIRQRRYPTNTAFPRSPGKIEIPIANVRETRPIMLRAKSKAGTSAALGRARLLPFELIKGSFWVQVEGAGSLTAGLAARAVGRLGRNAGAVSEGPAE